MIALIKKFINNGLTEALDVKLDRIEVDTQAIETKVDTVDTVVDTLNTNVGSDADSSSAAGSVHAKLKDVNNKLEYDDYRTVLYSTALSAGFNWYTALNISGQGRVIWVGGYSNVLSNTQLRITIDGNVTTISQPNFVQANSYTSPGSGYSRFDLNINFTSNLKVEIGDSATTATNVNAMIAYVI